MKTILHVSDADEWTGGCAQLLALAKGLKERGWASWIACRPGSALVPAAREAGLEVFPAALRQDYDLVSAWRLAGFVAKTGIEVVHSHHSRAHGVCLLAKLVLRLRGLAAPVLVVSRRVSFKTARNPFSLFKYRSVLNDAYAAVADAVKDVLVAGGIDAGRVVVVHSGVDTERFAPRPADQEARRSLGIPEGRLAVCKVANYSSWKGQSCFLEAAALLAREGRPLHFVLAGRDTDGPELRRETQRLGLEGRVTLAGFRRDMPEVLSGMAVSVNAALSGEGLSGVVRESLAMGIAAVASDVAGNREILGAQADKFLFPPGDAAALAGRIAWVLDHGDEARRAVESLRERVRRDFSIGAMIEKTERLYLSLLDGRLAPEPAGTGRMGAWARAARTSLVAVLHPLAWAVCVSIGVRALAGIPAGGKAAFLAALAGLLPLSCGAGASALLRLGFRGTLGGLLVVPVLALALTLAIEPRPFMHITTADGMRMVYFPDPSWRALALLWTAVCASCGAAGWLLGQAWRGWPRTALTRPPAP
ncbi:MAG: glycosyltransferase [Elusimicrobia bacterium]|nr:glycosyltransferase [Elusimicrobiota bacterium]